MMSKITIALAAAAIFGAASAAQVNEPRDEYGGYKYGPMGQRMGTTSHWRATMPASSVLLSCRATPIWHREHDRRW